MKKFKMAMSIFSSRTQMKIIMIMMTIMFGLYIMGFLLNGFKGYNFNLDSIWAGITAIGAGGLLQFGNYTIDSLYNSPKGQPPKDGGDGK